MKNYEVQEFDENDTPHGEVYTIKARDIYEVRHWIINHLDTSCNYQIKAV